MIGPNPGPILFRAPCLAAVIRLLAVGPGSEESGFVDHDPLDDAILEHGIVDNEILLAGSRPTEVRRFRRRRVSALTSRWQLRGRPRSMLLSVGRQGRQRHLARRSAASTSESYRGPCNQQRRGWGE